MDHHKTTTLSSIAMDLGFHLRNNIEEKRVKSHLVSLVKNKPRKPATERKSDPKPDLPFISHRLKNYRNSTSKIQLLPFLQSIDPMKIKSLIRSLDLYYSHLPPFSKFEKNWSEEMALSFQQTAAQYKLRNEPFTIEDLSPSDPQLKELFTIMMEGCPSYTFESRDLFPAFEEIFSLNPKQTSIGFFPDLPYPTLIALFSKDFADELLEKEKPTGNGPAKALPKEEVLDLLKNHGHFLDDPNLFTFQGKAMPSRGIVVKNPDFDMAYIYDAD